RRPFVFARLKYVFEAEEVAVQRLAVDHALAVPGLPRVRRVSGDVALVAALGANQPVFGGWLPAILTGAMSAACVTGAPLVVTVEATIPAHPSRHRHQARRAVVGVQDHLFVLAHRCSLEVVAGGSLRLSDAVIGLSRSIAAAHS